MDISEDKEPLARKQGLVVKEVSGEVLVYDLDRDKAHCLNQTAALVWKYCDGHTTVSRIAKSLEQDLQAPVDQKIVWYALLQLGKDHLLEERIVPPAIMAGMNRRDMIRALGLAAVVAVPVVTSIVAPTPAQAATCIPSGGACTASAECCSNLCNPPYCA
jgi:hypothetical protein